MADTKEIIRVLGFIQEYFDNHADEQEPNARKELFRDWSEVTLDAIALLKAQEPRVMTLEEVVSHGDKEAMYLEHMDGEMIVCPVVLLTTFLDIDKDCSNFAGGWRCCGNFEINGYSKTWRCWTSKPTDEQRKNTPWNKDNENK